MFNSKKVLFVLAHFDDEVFSAGTIKKLTTSGIIVDVLIICGQGHDLVNNREEIFRKNSEMLGYNCYIMRRFDLSLNTMSLDGQLETEKIIKDYIYSMAPDTVITHNKNDLHMDHKWVSDKVRIITRPSQDHNIKNLYECCVPGSTEYGDGFDYDTIVNITNEQPYKTTCVQNYNLGVNGVSNFNGSMVSSEYFGMLHNMKRAEVFKTIYVKI